MALARNIATVGGGTLLSRLLAYVRDAGIATLLGSGPYSEALFAVMQVINFFRRLLAESALNSAFVPIWLGLRSSEDGEANANCFTRRSLLAMFSITGVASLLVFVFANPLIVAITPGFDFGKQMIAAVLLTIAAPYICVLGLVAVLAAALNAEHRVTAVTVSTVTFNVVMVITIAMLFGEDFDPFERVGVLAAATVVAVLLQFVITGATWLMTGRRWRRARIRAPDQTSVFFTRAIPGLVAAGIPQLKMIAAAAVASSSPAAVSWLYYANRLYELPLGVASIAIAAVIVPDIAASLRAGEAETSAAQSRAFEIALGLALPAATGFALLADPVAGGLFERGAFTPQDTTAVAAVLMAICGGLPGHVLDKVFGAISFAHEDTQTPMLTALASLIVAILSAVLLFPHYGHVGVAAAIALSGWAGASLLGVILYQRGWLRLDPQARRNLPRIVFATAVMGGTVIAGSMAGHTLWPAVAASSLGRLGLLIALVPLGVAVYLVAVQLFDVVRLKDLLAAIRHGS